MPAKYITVNGRFQINPEYKSEDGQPVKIKTSTVADPKQALVSVCTIDDAMEAADETGGQMEGNTRTAIETIQSDQYIQSFAGTSGHRQPVADGGQIADLMSSLFSEMEIPIGLIQKLIMLRGWRLHFKIDDSQSMTRLCANGKTRWENVKERLLGLLKLLQMVPTGEILISFLDRYTTIKLNHYGKTPAQFYSEAEQKINTEFRNGPNGSTPIYRNVLSMLNGANGRTAHYLFTDGDPNEYEKEVEIRMIKDLLSQRSSTNASNNPFTFLCCSDDPLNTMWMHEIEEFCCAPGKPLGYVAALQNFHAERLEVLNDQGPAFPYSEALWKICNLVAAMDPYLLDALDQHEPLTKLSLDSILGRVSTFIEYLSYFNQHPNANWMFGEKFPDFLNTYYAYQIPIVADFENRLARELNNDINAGRVASEPNAIARVEEQMIQTYSLQRDMTIRRARQDFWNNHYVEMEKTQLRWSLSSVSNWIRQDLWGDYVAASGLGALWGAFVGNFHNERPIPAEFVSAAPQQPVVGVTLGEDDSNPPPYSSVATAAPQVVTPQVFQPYSNASYNYRYSIPQAGENQGYGSSNYNVGMWQPSRSGQVAQQQYQQDNNNCCCLVM